MRSPGSGGTVTHSGRAAACSLRRAGEFGGGGRGPLSKLVSRDNFWNVWSSHPRQLRAVSQPGRRKQIGVGVGGSQRAVSRFGRHRDSY